MWRWCLWGARRCGMCVGMGLQEQEPHFLKSLIKQVGWVCIPFLYEIN